MSDNETQEEKLREVIKNIDFEEYSINRLQEDRDTLRVENEKLRGALDKIRKMNNISFKDSEALAREYIKEAIEISDKALGGEK